MIRVGFTGTRRGMTPAQRGALRFELGKCEQFIGVHGCAIGADAEFDGEARCEPGFQWMEVYPGDLLDQTAVLRFGVLDSVAPPEATLSRNRRIVESVDFMLCAPETPHQVLRSGTWATYRHAKIVGVPVVLLLPNGARVLG